MSDYKLAIKIAGELDGSLSTAVKSAESMLKALNGDTSSTGSAITKALSTTGSGIANVVKGFAKGNLAGVGAIGTAATAMVKSSVSVGQEFEAAMASTAATAGIDRQTEAYKRLEAAALEAGATTNKTATQSAEALKYFFLAGWDEDAAISALPDMIKLSSVSGADLATTADLLTDSFGAMGLTMDDYAGYVNMVARADSAANYTSSMLMETLTKAGGAARVVGMDINDLATAAGILANNGTKGTNAGTALNSMITRIGANDAATTELKKLGVTLYDNEGQFRGFKDVLVDMNTAMQELGASEGPEAVNAAMKEIWGTHYYSQGKYLLDAVSGTGEAWDSLAANLEAAYTDMGVLENRYSTETDTLSGDMQLLSSSFESLRLAIFNALNGTQSMLRGVVQELTYFSGALRKAFEADGVMGLAEPLGEEISRISKAIQENGGEAIQAATEFVSKIYETIGSPENSADIGGAAATIVSNLANGFLETTGDFALMATNVASGFLNALNEMDAGEGFAGAAAVMMTKIGEAFSLNGGNIGEAAGLLVASLITGLAEHSGEIISGGIEIVGGLVRGLIQGAVKLVAAGPQIIANLIQGILEAVPTLFNVGVGIVQTIIEGITDTAISLGDWLNLDYGDVSAETVAFAQENGEAMAEAMREAWQSGMVDSTSFAEYMDVGAIDALVNGWIDAGATIVDVQAEINNAMASGAELEQLQTLQAAADVYGELTNLSASYVQSAQEAAAAAESMGDGVAQVEAMVEQVGSGMDTIQEALGGVADTGGLEGIQAELESMSAEAQATASAADDLKQALNFEGFGGDLATDLLSATDIQARADEISTAMSTVADSVSASMTSMQGAFDSFSASTDAALATAGAAMTAFLAIVEASMQSATSSAEAGAAGIVGAFAGMDLSGVAANAMAGLTAGILAEGASAVAAAQSIASQITGAMANALQIHSPSRVMFQMGEYVTEGFTLGMNAGKGDVAEASSGIARAVETGAGGSLSGALRGLGGAGAATGGSSAISFSPVINIQGNASEADVRSALSWGMEEFERLYNRLMWERRREAFA